MIAPAIRAAPRITARTDNIIVKVVLSSELLMAIDISSDIENSDSEDGNRGSDGQYGLVPVQFSVSLQFVPDGRYLSGGHTLLLPVQYSGRSQRPTG